MSLEASAALTDFGDRVPRKEQTRLTDESSDTATDTVEATLEVVRF